MFIVDFSKLPRALGPARSEIGASAVLVLTFGKIKTIIKLGIAAP